MYLFKEDGLHCFLIASIFLLFVLLILYSAIFYRLAVQLLYAVNLKH